MNQEQQFEKKHFTWVPFIHQIGKVKHPWPWAVGLIAAGVVGISTTTHLIGNQTTSKADIDKMTVPVKLQDITLRITASGTVKPVDNVNISPKTAGIVAQLRVEQGDKVEQGQILAQMDDAQLQAQLLQQRANVAQAQAQLDLARAGSRPEEIAQARQRLAQAQAQLDLARAGSRPEEIAQGKAQVAAAQAKVNLTIDRVIRNQKLYAQGAISKDKLDEVVSDDKSAQASLLEVQERLRQSQNGSRSQDIQRLEASVAEAQQSLNQSEKGSRPEEIAQKAAALKAAQAQQDTVQVQLNDTIIRAPFTGIVTQKYATVGAFVTPTTSASSTASATSSSIVALAKGLEVWANVPEVDIGQIKPGQAVEIVADAYPNQVFKGQVKLIAPEAVIDNNVTSFKVRVELVTGQDKLRSGMNADVTFLGNQLKQALVVPTVAIVTQKGQTGVLIPDPKNQATFHPVTIGSSIGSQTQILKGIQQGQRVFVNLPQDQMNKLDSNQSKPN